MTALHWCSQGQSGESLRSSSTALPLPRKNGGFPLPCNPVLEIKLPDTAKARSRRLPQADLTKLLDALNANTAWYLRPLIALAVETGMRRGELLSIKWQNIDWKARTLDILKTKNGHPRTIPLTPKALETLSGLPTNSERVFPVSSNAVRLAWGRLRTRAGVEDLRLHDLRHEAVSRFFELGLTTPEVALISGHRDPRMLQRYTHLRPEKVAEKLAKADDRLKVKGKEPDGWGPSGSSSTGRDTQNATELRTTLGLRSPSCSLHGHELGSATDFPTHLNPLAPAVYR